MLCDVLKLYKNFIGYEIIFYVLCLENYVNHGNKMAACNGVRRTFVNAEMNAQVGRPRKYTKGYAPSLKQLYILEAMLCYFIITWQISCLILCHLRNVEHTAVSKIVHNYPSAHLDNQLEGFIMCCTEFASEML